jgi:hypothetical protein
LGEFVEFGSPFGRSAPTQAIEIVAIEKKVMVARSAYWLNHDPSGLTEVA